MLVYINSNGTIQTIYPTVLTQGSNETSALIVIAEGLSQYSAISVNLKLQNDQIITLGTMTPLDDFTVNNEIVNAYSIPITKTMTNFPGNVKITFKVTDTSSGIINSYLAIIQVTPTLKPVLPVAPDDDWYQNITEAYAYITGKTDEIIPNLFGEEAPTTETIGIFNQLYFDTTNKKIYRCAEVSETYTWVNII